VSMAIKNKIDCGHSKSSYYVYSFNILKNVNDAHKQLLVATATGDHKALLKPPIVVIEMPELPPVRGNFLWRKFLDRK